MSVYKHSPTLISSNIRSSSSTYLLLVLAVSISQSKGVVAVPPPRNSQQAQEIARTKAIREGFSNLVLELTSGVRLSIYYQYSLISVHMWAIMTTADTLVLAEPTQPSWVSINGVISYCWKSSRGCICPLMGLPIVLPPKHAVG